MNAKKRIQEYLSSTYNMPSLDPAILEGLLDEIAAESQTKIQNVRESYQKKIEKLEAQREKKIESISEAILKKIATPDKYGKAIAKHYSQSQA